MHIECPQCDAPLDVEPRADVLQCEECSHRFHLSDVGSIACPGCGALLAAPKGASVILCGQCRRRIQLGRSPAAGGTPPIRFMSDDPSEKADSHRETSILDGPPDLQRERLDAMQGEFGGRYEIIEALGHGGMGAVYKARQKQPSRIVVLKVMLNGRFASRKYHQRFAREAQAVARLKHPGIVSVYEYGDVAGQPYFTMEYVEGCSLREYVVRHGLDKRSICELVLKVSHAVAYAHQRGVIHRDIKPTNILVDGHGNPRLLDFGLARMAGDTSEDHPQMTEAGEVMGTPSYMSPEQTLGRPEEIDIRSDVYSLGVLFYELLTGALPYRIDRARPLESLRVIRDYVPKRPSAINAKLDGDLDAIVMKCIEKERDLRYQSAVELGEDIRRYLRGHPVEARRTTTFYHLRKLLWRHRGLFLPIVASLGVAAAVVGVFVLGLMRAEKGAHNAVLNADASARTADAEREKLVKFIMDLQSVRLKVESLMAEGRWEEAWRMASFAEKQLPQEAGLAGFAAEVRESIAVRTADADREIAQLVQDQRFRDARERMQRLKDLATQIDLPELAAQMDRAAGEFDEVCRRSLLQEGQRSARSLQKFLLECPGSTVAPEVRRLFQGLIGRIRFTDWPLDAGQAARNQATTAEVLGLAPTCALELPDGARLALVLVPAGKFAMGTAHDGPGYSADQEPEHTVRITYPFYMSATEVTRAQYLAVTGSGPEADTSADGDLPAAVSWERARQFCEKLSLRNHDRLTVRLPSEAEWEYACCAGSEGPYGQGVGAADLDEFAWYAPNSGGSPHPVGGKRANAWGLHDMHGNVLEWCQDWYDARYYLSSPVQDPPGPQTGDYRVLRGGSCSDEPQELSSTCRKAAAPDSVRPTYGFRVVADIFTDRKEAVSGTGVLLLRNP
jgi:formylglycine-generating enzyme required for sulfatase activity/tRNA A-37 threonylcarbamoyl transferase component Bud32